MRRSRRKEKTMEKEKHEAAMAALHRVREIVMKEEEE